jgi:hypothetical protein
VNVTLRWVIVLILLILAAASGVRGYRYFTESAAMPEFTDPARAETLLGQALDEQSDGARQQWSDAYYPLQTDKWPLQHQGEGWVALAVSLFAFGVAAAVVTAANGDLLATPRRSAPVRLALCLAFLLQVPFSYWYFTRQVGTEHCCAAWADSSGIPIMTTSILTLVLLAGSAIYFLPLIRDSRLPAVLLRPIARLQSRLLLWLLYLVPPAALFSAIVVAGLTEVASLVPLGVIGLWTTFVALASALKPYQKVAA